MFLVRRPSPSEIDRFLTDSRDLPLSYAPVGLARQGASGFRLDALTTTIGVGEEAFGRAKSALRAWRQFDCGWTEVFPRAAPVEPGTVVAVLIRHLGCWSLNGCRVVSIEESGFTCGTLPNHAEQGEEIFSVRFDRRTGHVDYSIRAASRPRAALAWLGYPVTRALQARFRRDSSAAMARAITS